MVEVTWVHIDCHGIVWRVGWDISEVTWVAFIGEK